MANLSVKQSFSNRWISAAKIAGVVLLITAANAGIVRPLYAQEMLQRVLTVTGQGEEKIKATEATVNLAVEAQGKTANEAQAEVARRADAVVKFLRSQNVRNLQTTGINLSPSYSYTDNKPKIIGYQASNSVNFTVDADQAGALLDQAVSVGASRIDGISFKASDAAIDVAQKQALQDATRDARRQAEAVLSALGYSEKSIVGIQVNGAAPQPIFQQRLKAFGTEAASADASTPVEAGEQIVGASVTLQIQY